MERSLLERVGFFAKDFCSTAHNFTDLLKHQFTIPLICVESVRVIALWTQKPLIRKGLVRRPQEADSELC